ncbi:NFACT RNA binding domain-containing protein [Erysipelothrix rhusiopathiae]|nr:NFACT RNA binding domain-containing protein [Erysipelothrix rhusiopathiae]
MSLGIINQKRMKKHNVKKKKKPNYLTITYDDETTIFVGKNNIQNDYLTFKLARKEDMWFHAANTFGTHVIIKTPELDEPKIRLCAHLAAFYSKARHGSSVEVYYTQAKNIKKIPGANPGLVSVSTQKSIFIDPDESLVASYLNK